MVNNKVDLYNVGPRLETALNSIDKWNICKKNKEFIKQFIRFITAEGLSDKRKLKYIYTLKTISTKIGVDFDKATKEDIVKLFEYIQNNGYKPNTVKDFKSVIKRFYKVLFGDNEEYPKAVKWLKINVKLSDQDKNHPLTEEDIKKIIKVIDSSMYRCLVSLAFESCCRPSEYLSLKLKDIKENDHGFELTVSGKTGSRPIFLIQSSPYIAEWLNHHKNKDPESFLFYDKDVKKPLCVFKARLNYKRYFNQTKISKPSHLYWLRHSGITYKRILGMSDSALQNYAGWVGGTRQIKIYSHLTGRECKDEVETLYGIKKADGEKKEFFKICMRCNEKNGFAEQYCSKCGLNLNRKEALNKLETNDLISKFITLIMDDKEVFSKVKKKVKEDQEALSLLNQIKTSC